VVDHAVVLHAAEADVVERDGARSLGEWAHALVPSARISTGKTDDDIELSPENTELVDPGLVAVEYEEFHAPMTRNSPSRLTDLERIVFSQMRWT